MEKKIKTIIVDDEKQSRLVLRNLLTSFSNEIEVIGEADSAETAFELIQQLKPELLFLDIQMPRGSGFSLLMKFNEIPFKIIFVTSYDMYAINAIKFSALDYLLKPIEVNDLSDAIGKAVKSISDGKNPAPQIINLLHNLNQENKDFRIAIQSGELVKLISTQSIIYIEANGSYCNIITTDNEKLMAAKYLRDFEDYFGEQSNFVRIHKSYLINIKQMKAYSKGEPCIMEMVNGKTFEVARRKKQEVLEKLKKQS